jgi:acetyl esterase/lipase
VSETIQLWDGAAPGSEAATWHEATSRFPGGDLIVRNVVVPTLTPYLPEPPLANGTAVIVAPGGGFSFLSWEHEGTVVAEWLACRGVAAFVLKYRVADTGATDDEFKQSMAALFARLMPDGKPRKVDPDKLAPDIAPLAFADGAQAVRLLRRRAGTLGVHPDAVGFVGFSAGAFVATAIALDEDPSGRPDFVAAIYGGAPRGSVGEATPPLFSVVAADDVLCLDTCLDTFRAWRTAGRPAELHVYDQGGHGFGAKKLGLPADSWLDRLGDWMHAHGFLP